VTHSARGGVVGWCRGMLFTPKPDPTPPIHHRDTETQRKTVYLRTA
jgi:hypothetical protein